MREALQISEPAQLHVVLAVSCTPEVLCLLLFLSPAASGFWPVWALWPSDGLLDACVCALSVCYLCLLVFACVSCR